VNAIGVDVGGTKIAAGVVAPGGEVLSEVRYPSSGSRKQLMKNIFRAIHEVSDGLDIGGVCLAVPGFVLTRESKVVFSPNLPTIEGIPLKETLEEEIGWPVTVENDGNAAAWGEFCFGVGKEARHLILVTLGTGVGAGVILDGAIMHGAVGAGGELGHVIVHATGPRCECGNRGCLEAYASGNAIARRAREVAGERPESALGSLAAERRILGEDVTELAGEGDEAASAVLDEAGKWLGVGLANFVNIFNPEVIAIGGGVATAGDLILSPAREEVRLRARPPSRDIVELKIATLGPESGVLGAAALARDVSGNLVLEP
jgi:glucokinase